jgi:hypothetical protein
MSLELRRRADALREDEMERPGTIEDETVVGAFRRAVTKFPGEPVLQPY